MTEATKPKKARKPTKKQLEKMEADVKAAEEVNETLVPKTINNTRIYNITVLFKSGAKITLDNYFDFIKSEPDEENKLKETIWIGSPSEITETHVLIVKDELVAAVIYREATPKSKPIRKSNRK